VKKLTAAVFAKDWSAGGQVQIVLLLLLIIGVLASAVLSN
jgi:hypothetical protein